MDYSYSVTFDSNMSETGRTNGINVYQIQSTYGDPNDPVPRRHEVHKCQMETRNHASWDQIPATALTSASRLAAR